MNDYYDVLIKRVNEHKFNVVLDYCTTGWKNVEKIGKIVHSGHADEWWFVPHKNAMLCAKELRVIAERIDDLEKELE